MTLYLLVKKGLDQYSEQEITIVGYDEAQYKMESLASGIPLTSKEELFLMKAQTLTSFSLQRNEIEKPK